MGNLAIGKLSSSRSQQPAVTFLPHHSTLELKKKNILQPDVLYNQSALGGMTDRAGCILLEDNHWVGRLLPTALLREVSAARHYCWGIHSLALLRWLWKGLCFASHAPFYVSMLLPISTALHHHGGAWLSCLSSSSSIWAPRKTKHCPPWCQPLRFPAVSTVALPDAVHHLRRFPSTRTG